MYSFYFRVEVSCKVAFEERTCNIIVNKFVSFLLNLKLDFNNDIDFAFADINCSLGFRYKTDSFGYFNSENELHNLIVNKSLSPHLQRCLMFLCKKFSVFQ